MEKSDKYTKDDIKELLQREDRVGKRAVLKGVVVIFQLQTDDEQASETTHYHNGVGYSGCDASYMSYLAKWILKNNDLDEPHFSKARKKIQKYAGQLAKVANGEIDVNVRLN